MVTRLYLNTAAGAINIGAEVGSLWDDSITGAFTTLELSETPDGTANASHYTTGLGSGTNPCDIAFGQFMSDPLPSGVTIDGDISGVICCRQYGGTMYTQLAAYVVDSSGALVHTLLGGSTSGGSAVNGPSANNRNMPRGGATAVSSYTTVNATSRVVVEIGMRHPGTGTTLGGWMYFGSGVTSDLPSGDGTSNNLLIRPWVEFSADLFTPPSGGGSRSQVAAFYGFHDQEDLELVGWRRRRSGLVARRWED